MDQLLRRKNVGKVILDASPMKVEEKTENAEKAYDLEKTKGDGAAKAEAGDQDEKTEGAADGEVKSGDGEDAGSADNKEDDKKAEGDA